MSRATSNLTPQVPTEPVFPLSVSQYHRMIAAGVVTEDDPVELIEGVLVFHMPKNPIHEFVLAACSDALRTLIPSGWMLRSQAPITLSDGEPEPDFAIVRGTRHDYVDRHPGAGDVALVIEVSDSTLARDRGMKLRSFARAGIAEYWIVNIESRTVEVYTSPHPGDTQYASRVDHADGDDVALRIEGVQRGSIPVKALFP